MEYMQKNLTPPEIRFRLLQMAKETLYENHRITRDHRMGQWNVEMEKKRATGGEVTAPSNFDRFPSAEEVVAMAQTFEEFVRSEENFSFTNDNEL